MSAARTSGRPTTIPEERFERRHERASSADEIYRRRVAEANFELELGLRDREREREREPVRIERVEVRERERPERVVVREREWEDDYRRDIEAAREYREDDEYYEFEYEVADDDYEDEYEYHQPSDSSSVVERPTTRHRTRRIIETRRVRSPSPIRIIEPSKRARIPVPITVRESRRYQSPSRERIRRSLSRERLRDRIEDENRRISARPAVPTPARPMRAELDPRLQRRPAGTHHDPRVGSFDQDDVDIRASRHDSHRRRARHGNDLVRYNAPRGVPREAANHKQQPYPDHRQPRQHLSNTYGMTPAGVYTVHPSQRPGANMPAPPPPNMAYAGPSVAAHPGDPGLQYMTTIPSSYMHQQHTPAPAPLGSGPQPSGVPEPMSASFFQAKYEGDREREARARAEAERQREFCESIRREVDESLRRAAEAQKERDEKSEMRAKSEAERRLEFEALIRSEVEMSISKASEIQKKRVDKTEKWARTEVQRLKGFEELIKNDVQSTMKVVKTLEAEQKIRDAEAESLQIQMEIQVNKAMEALEKTERLRAELRDMRANRAGTYEESPPPRTPPFRPAHGRRASYSEHPSPSPAWESRSPPPAVPEAPETDPDVVEESHENYPTDHRRQSSRRRYSPSVASYHSYVSTSSRDGRPRNEEDGEMRRDMRMVREELLDPIVEVISGLATAVMFGGLHFQSPPVFMHYPPHPDESNSSRSVSTCEESGSDDRETVTPQQNEQPSQIDESGPEQEPNSQSPVLVSAPDHSDQEATSTQTTDSVISNDETMSPDDRSVVAESWTTATEESVPTYNPLEYTKPVKEEQHTLEEDSREDDTDETPTLVNSGFPNYTAVEKMPLVENQDNTPEMSGEESLDKNYQVPAIINQQIVSSEAIESKPSLSSDAQPGKELLGPLNNHESEQVDSNDKSPQPSTSDKRKQRKAADSRHRYWDGSYIPKHYFPSDPDGPNTAIPDLDRKGRTGGHGRKGRNAHDKVPPLPVLKNAFIPIPYFHPVFGGVPPSRGRRRRGGDEEATVD
ncbi:kinase [Ilyonectria robusta]